MAEDLSDTALRWEDGVPVSTRFNDPYYARSDGLAESRHVFLDGNGLATRFQGVARFHIAEMGFGTGLNFLAAWMLWRDVAASASVLHFTSFELYPMSPDEQRRALSAWPALSPLADAMLAGDLPGVVLDVVHGNVRDTLPAWEGAADAWFLDGFAPARNPDMWGVDMMQSVHDHTAPKGSFATYTAAGHVRRSLQAVGFHVRKVPGHGTKREMLVGTRD